ncbi:MULTISPECIES: hypothetical protein [Paenibacillus]|uniref:hypothetical protein n=1 Tax=Paenibacillus TaxID=44249 RepID=UPI0009A911ED|nr:MULTISPECIES: hypothetical protein [Paenibacillus]MCZ1269391.1 hypothetical protein [Paenibacillus tundrae]SLK16611.1 hypothetical protein SAMN06272722_110204 [Paenibacillus sp. RU5A]SOC74418.1 hypothetical protein SAMN05880581_110204 [Paenibacillus sp. RU26A]SOC76584.1 hypothetical protein SAMN05880586_110204 [Paenibacillus sp. RU5M]
MNHKLSQLSAMTDEQLNGIIARCLGYNLMDDYRQYNNPLAEKIWFNPQKAEYVCKLSEFTPCSDHNALTYVTHEVLYQDAGGYINNLVHILGVTNQYHYNNPNNLWTITLEGVSVLLQSSPRSCVIAAILVLQYRI